MMTAYDSREQRLQREIDALTVRINQTSSERKRATYRALLELALREQRGTS